MEFIKLPKTIIKFIKYSYFYIKKEKEKRVGPTSCGYPGLLPDDENPE